MTKSDTKNKADVVPDRESDRLPLFVLLRDDTRDHPRTFMCRTLLLLMRYSSADVTGHTVFHCLCISHNRYTSYNSNHGRCTFQRVLYNYCIFCVKNLSIKNFNSISFFFCRVYFFDHIRSARDYVSRKMRMSQRFRS